MSAGSWSEKRTACSAIGWFAHSGRVCRWVAGVCGHFRGNAIVSWKGRRGLEGWGFLVQVMIRL